MKATLILAITGIFLCPVLSEAQSLKWTYTLQPFAAGHSPQFETARSDAAGNLAVSVFYTDNGAATIGHRVIWLNGLNGKAITIAEFPSGSGYSDPIVLNVSASAMVISVRKDAGGQAIQRFVLNGKNVSMKVLDLLPTEFVAREALPSLTAEGHARIADARGFFVLDQNAELTTIKRYLTK